ncbi:MAG: AAA family ATPase [Bryobacteraceae bacterium]
MFNALSFITDQACGEALEKLAAESRQVAILSTIDHYPQAHEFEVLRNKHNPDIIFLDLSDRSNSLTVAANIRAYAPLTAIIGFGGGWDEDSEQVWSQAGITDLLISPVTAQTFREGVDRAIHRLHGAVQQNLVAFLPGKAGSGCTTVALNVAGQLAKLGKKVLVIECDLHSGVLSTLLNVRPQYSVLDALENCSDLSYAMWTSYTVKAQGVDFLLSKRQRRDNPPSWSNYHQLLQFARDRYDFVLVDMPEVVNDATVEIVRRAKDIFAVSTAEVPSLTLALQRCAELHDRWVADDRIQIILNRWQSNDLKVADVERLLKHSVAAVFRNDYAEVQRATGEGSFVDRGTELGADFQAFAKKLAGIEEVVVDESKTRFAFFKKMAER